jgi:hypothetical protein
MTTSELLDLELANLFSRNPSAGLKKAVLVGQIEQAKQNAISYNRNQPNLFKLDLSAYDILVEQLA